MTNDEVHSALVRWVKTATGNTTTIKAYQSGPAPDLPYIMVNMTGTVEVRRWQSKTEYTETDDLNTSGEKIILAAPVIEMEWRFSVHAYGSSPSDVLRPIVSAVKISQPQESLLPDLLIHEVSQVRSLPEWINNAWQPRAQMDVYVRGIIRDQHVVDVISEYSFDIEKLP